MARVPRNLWLVGFTSLLTDASTELVFPLLPLFIATLGGSALYVGTMEGLAESVASGLKLVAGRWSDRLGRRKGITMAGYAFSSVMKLGFPLATLPAQVVLLRGLDRIGKGLRNPARDVLIAESVEPARRGWAFGLHRAMDTTGAFVGPFLGLLLLPLLSLRGIFLVAVVPAFLGVLVLTFVREPPPIATASNAKLTWPKDPRLHGYLLTIAVFTLGNFGYVFLLLRGADIGLGVRGLLLLQLLHTAVYAALAFPLGAVTDRVGRVPLVAASMVAVAVASLTAARLTAPTWAALAPSAALFGVAFAAFEGNGRALAVDLAPPGQRGTVLGAYHATIGLAALPAGLLAGLLWAYDFRLAFAAGGLFSLVALLELLVLTRGEA